MNKVLVVAKEYPEYYNTIMYVQWIRETNKGNWYYVTKTDVKKIGIPDLYLGESQIQHL